ncbi:MAG: hypothetical protein AAGC58_11535 [Asticcacaulis sp.]
MNEQRLHDGELGPVSTGLAAVLFDACPHLRDFAKMTTGCEGTGQSLLIEVPSPTGDPNRTLVIWTDEAATPSIEFGPSHTHESADIGGYNAILKLAEKIFSEELVIAVELGGPIKHAFWLDLSTPDSLADELTSPYSSGRLMIKSWAGGRDRHADLNDIIL